MTAKSDINSTERLLNLIRGGKTTATPPKNTAPAMAPVGKWGGRFKRRPKGTVVGVDLGYNELRMVRMSKRRQLVDVSLIPYEEGLRRASPGFHLFLKSALSGFCRGGRVVEVWSSVPSGNLDLRYLRIPKVPKKQEATAVFHTYRKENPINEKTHLFDFEVLGDIVEEGVRKTEVAAYTVPKSDIQELTDLFGRAGYPLTGVTAIPFAVQNLFRTDWLQGREEEVCNLYVGRNWSRIDMFSKGTIRLSRGIKAGMESMVDSLGDRLEARMAGKPEEIFADFDFGGGAVLEKEDETPREKATPNDAEVQEKARSLFNRLISGGDFPTQLSPGVSIREHETFDMILPALDRLTRQVERTLDYYYQKLGGERVDRVYLGGLVAGYPRISSYLTQQLGVPVEVLAPLDGLAGNWPPVTSAGLSDRERAYFTPALGLSLSDNAHTPNAIHTYRDKEKAIGAKTIRDRLVMVFCVLLLVMGGYYHLKHVEYKLKTEQVRALDIQIHNFQPPVNQDLIMTAMARIKANNTDLTAYGRRYQALAVIGEMSDVIPAEIRLMNFEADLGPVAPPAEAEKAEGAPPAKKVEAKKKGRLLMEGVVRGAKSQVDGVLAQYLLRLQRSPLFGQPNLLEKNVIKLGEEEVLFFRAEVEII